MAQKNWYVLLNDPTRLFVWEDWQRFLGHEDPFVRYAAARREDCPDNILEEFENDPDVGVLISLAGNLRASAAVFERAFYYPKPKGDGTGDSAPKLSACGNPHLPLHLAKQFRTFDWAELLAYINTETALKEALVYAATLAAQMKSILGAKPTDWNKELRIVGKMRLLERLICEHLKKCMEGESTFAALRTQREGANSDFLLVFPILPSDEDPEKVEKEERAKEMAGGLSGGLERLKKRGSIAYDLPKGGFADLTVIKLIDNKFD